MSAIAGSQLADSSRPIITRSGRVLSAQAANGAASRTTSTGTSADDATPPAMPPRDRSVLPALSPRDATTRRSPPSVSVAATRDSTAGPAISSRRAAGIRPVDAAAIAVVR
jgi:hypothetical protein